ncbi:putative sporulation protein YtxC [Cytobacillus spongiae]|uniref:putative sporulation protein YtxC n=1 Tax=Cytobacillus spongiae TaxID=2901381 RepID=UPI001F3028A2|nr:putative sporulation protein YtxC [Cytobacillus spongiae]UII55135.1 putative sporulation protein YtxC [Cytobacillus spongiae]
MIKIIFQNKDDAKKLHQHLHNELGSSNHLNNTLLIEDQHIVSIQLDRSNTENLESYKSAFYDFIFYTKQDDWFLDLLENQYFFREEEEQRQILDIIHSILEGQREELMVFINEFEREHHLKQAIDQIFEDQNTFSFDSFVKFRLRPFMERLEKYVEISIDEYKMEQEYQMFIETLRQFLFNRQAKLQHLHLMIDDGITFFDAQYYEMKRAELMRMIDRKLLVNHPVYVDSLTIAPLLSIAPQIIYLYSDDEDQPLVRTIHNIFEERVILLPVSQFYEEKRQFPFTADEKM